MCETGWSSCKQASKSFKTARAAGTRIPWRGQWYKPLSTQPFSIKALSLWLIMRHSSQNQGAFGGKKLNKREVLKINAGTVKTESPADWGLHSSTQDPLQNPGTLFIWWLQVSLSPSAKSASSHDLGPLNQKLLTSTQQTRMPDY